MNVGKVGAINSINFKSNPQSGDGEYENPVSRSTELLKEAIVKVTPVSTPVPVSNPCENEERELLKLLLKYGAHVIFEIENPENNIPDPVYVAVFILSELDADQMVSVNPAIKMVYDEYRDHLDDENFDAIKHFVNHPERQISQLVSDILSEKNKLSKFWCCY